MSIYFGSIGSFINTILTILMVISIGIGLYLVYIWKNFNEDLFRRAQGTPAEIAFQNMSPNRYLIGQIIIIAVAIIMLNIIGAVLCLIATPYVQKLSLEKMAQYTTGVEQPKTREINFDD